MWCFYHSPAGQEHHQGDKRHNCFVIRICTMRRHKEDSSCQKLFVFIRRTMSWSYAWTSSKPCPLARFQQALASIKGKYGRITSASTITRRTKVLCTSGMKYCEEVPLRWPVVLRSWWMSVCLQRSTHWSSFSTTACNTIKTGQLLMCVSDGSTVVTSKKFTRFSPKVDTPTWQQTTTLPWLKQWRRTKW